MKKRKGQVLVEYMILFIVLLSVLAPILYIYNTSARQLGSSVGAENSIQKLRNAAETIHSLGYPSSEVVVFTLPQSVVSNRTFIENDTMQIGYYGNLGNIVDVVKELSFNVSGSIPSTEGTHFVRVSSLENGTVHFELLKFYISPDSFHHYLTNNAHTTFNITVINTLGSTANFTLRVRNLENKIDMNASTVINDNVTTLYDLPAHSNKTITMNVSTLSERGTFFGQVTVQSSNNIIAVPITLDVFVDSAVLHWIVDTPSEFNAGTYNDTFFNTTAVAVTPYNSKIYQVYTFDDTYIIHDVYARSAGVYVSQLKLNISGIPLNTSVEKVDVCFYINSVVGIVSTNTTDVKRVDDQSWGETISAASFNTQNITNTTSENLNSTTQGTWTCIDVTEQLATDYSLNNTYSTIRLENPDYPLEAAGNIENDENLRVGERSGTTGGNYMEYASRTKTNPSLRPYIVVNVSRRALAGSFDSGIFQANQSYKWHNISFSNSSLIAQAKSSADNITWTDFLGPDGTSDTYYSNGDSLNVSDGRYFQFRILNITTSEFLYWVNITYGE